jgi:hypothetical protein
MAGSRAAAEDQEGIKGKGGTTTYTKTKPSTRKVIESGGSKDLPAFAEYGGAGDAKRKRMIAEQTD